MIMQAFSNNALHFDLMNLMSIKNSFQGGKKPCNHFSFVNREVRNCLIPLVILLCLVVALPSHGEPSKDDYHKFMHKIGVWQLYLGTNMNCLLMNICLVTLICRL
jgi:hypothetical protein